MVKQNGKTLKKSLALFLGLALAITAPLNVCALENDPSAGISSVADSGEPAVDSGLPPLTKVPAAVTMSGSSTTVSTAEELEAALENVEAGGQITLSASIDYFKSISVEGKSFTLDLKSYTLTVTNDTGPGIQVKNAVLTVEGTGALSVLGTKGVVADNGTVTRVSSAAGTDGEGVLAKNGGIVEVAGIVRGTSAGAYATGAGSRIAAEGAEATTGDAVLSEFGGAVTVSRNAVSNGGYGVYCLNGNATVSGDVKGNSTAVYLHGMGNIMIGGGVFTTGGNGTAVEISFDSGKAGTVTIDGAVSASVDKYIKFSSQYQTKSAGVADPSKAGYLKYSGEDEGWSGGVVWIKGTDSSSIEAGTPMALESALNNVTDGGTIHLTANINYPKGIVVDGKTITFDVGNFTLNVNNSTGAVSGIGLEVKNKGHVNLVGAGQLNIVQNGSNTSSGVRTDAGSTATVTNIRVSVDSGSAFGAYAYGDGAVIRVLGDIVVMGEGGCGAKTWGDGQITIDGTIAAINYINIGTVYKDKLSGVDDPEKTGYLRYTTSPIETGIVWVKKPAAVCEMDGVPYTHLKDALMAVGSGETKTIRLLKNIDYNEGITLINRSLTFELNGCTLNVVNPNGDGIAVGPGGNLSLSGNGALNVTGTGCGVSVASNDSPAEATVTNATATAPDGKGAYVYNKATLTVLGDAMATAPRGIGAHALEGGTLTVKGNATGETYGAYSSSGRLTVEGNAAATGVDQFGRGTGIGVGARDCTVTVLGNVISNRVGAWPSAAGKIMIDGTITAPNYIQLTDDVVKGPNDFEHVTTKEGYRTYFHTFGNTVWVKGEAPAVYPLTVKNGTGGGSYVQGAAVTLQADESAEGKPFRCWNATGGSFTDANSAITLFTMPASAATVTAEFDTGEPTVTSVIILPSSVEVQKGTTQQFTATVNGTNSPDQTVTWSISAGFSGTSISETGLLTVASNESASTLMVTATSTADPSKSGTATVTVTQPGTTTYTATVNGSYAGTNGAGSYPQGTAVTIHAGGRSGYSFAGWTSSDGVTFANAGSATTSFIMPGKNVTVTANWSDNGGSSPGVGGGGGAAPLKYEAPVSGDSSGKLPVTVDQSAGSARTELDSTRSGLAADGKTVVVTMPKIPNVKAYALGIPVPDLSDPEGTGEISLKTDVGEINLPANMLTGTASASGNKAQVGIGKVNPSDLPESARTAVGSRPVVSLTLSIDGKTVNWNNPAAAVEVSIPYTPTAEELKSPENIVVWYIDGGGKLTKILGAKYDVRTGMVVFETTHFSYYGVGYGALPIQFTDTASHWAKDSIAFVAGRGLVSGTSATTFSPNVAVTRADFLMALGKLSGADVSGYKTSGFTDVKVTASAMPYIEWAVKNKIVKGIGGGKFGPDMQITREQMAVMMMGYAQATNTALTSSKQAAAFADEAKISSWAKEAVKAIQQTGVIVGKKNNFFDPAGSATRAEASAILHRFVELVAD